MARNRKAALQTGGGSPAPQEALDHMEEMVAAVIPEEIVTGIQGQDSTDYRETTQMQGILEQSAVDPWQQSKREVQRNSGELLHSLSGEKPTGETLNSPQRRIGYRER
ncbi:hypothetical protein NDU88_001069 [Pleurodeles waltl]|uniref:Uncharacterized protein n=1 Tax=Pleurodeles waltl TaxID=8319 RepID=A0AAV7WKQ5_PLEWA|nr:hypothetical protein NDU88_001069 [Pleurodeles waltl]